jgi:hypothetical protein
VKNLRFLKRALKCGDDQLAIIRIFLINLFEGPESF